LGIKHGTLYDSTHKAFKLSQDALLGFLDVLLAASDLDFGALMRSLLLLATVLFLLIHLVRDIHLNTELITELVDTRSLGTNNASNKFTLNVKLR
jgi:hypothetical protein